MLVKVTFLVESLRAKAKNIGYQRCNGLRPPCTCNYDRSIIFLYLFVHLIIQKYKIYVKISPDSKSEHLLHIGKYCPSTHEFFQSVILDLLSLANLSFEGHAYLAEFQIGYDSTFFRNQKI
jgi:hypothetical protein